MTISLSEWGVLDSVIQTCHVSMPFLPKGISVWELYFPPGFSDPRHPISHLQLWLKDHPYSGYFNSGFEEMQRGSLTLVTREERSLPFHAFKRLCSTVSYAVLHFNVVHSSARVGGLLGSWLLGIHKTSHIQVPISGYLHKLIYSSHRLYTRYPSMAGSLTIGRSLFSSLL